MMQEKTETETEIEITIEETNNLTVSKFLSTWIDAVRSPAIDMGPFKQDIELVQGSGRYMRLLVHKKLRIRKKNNSRARSKKGLPGISVAMLKGCYPTAVEVI